METELMSWNRGTSHFSTTLKDKLSLQQDDLRQPSDERVQYKLRVSEPP